MDQLGVGFGQTDPFAQLGQNYQQAQGQRQQFITQMIASGYDPYDAIKLANEFAPTPELDAGALEEVQNFQRANQMIGTFEDVLGDTGVVENPILARAAGVVKPILGSTGIGNMVGLGGIKQYSDLKQSLGGMLARSLGEVGAMSDSDVKRATQLLPTLGDSKGEAESKLNKIRTLVKYSQKMATQRAQMGTQYAATPSQQTYAMLGAAGDLQ